MRSPTRLIAVFLAGLFSTGAARAAGSLTDVQQAWLAKAYRRAQHGWIYLHVEGSPRERGFQHGYLLAHEIAENLRKTRVSWEYESALKWSWLTARAETLFAGKIDAENLAELEGITEGLNVAGVPVATRDILAYNGWIELEGYWWPTEFKKLKDGASLPLREGCSAFIATGSMTRDGNVVLGHNTMGPYHEALPNLVLDLQPDKGHRILMQGLPGWIHSGTDFFITDAGLVGAETTIGSFSGFDTNGVPEFVRMRRATQDAGSIDEWCDLMKKGNNGGYANAWLLGDIHRREIARLELGLKCVALERKSDGYFLGSNVAEDVSLLRWETEAMETDIRLSSVARRVRWKELMRQSLGKIDLAHAKQFEADHYDAFLKKVRPASRSLCGHFELEPVPSGAWPGVPFGPSGTTDAKVVDASLAAKMAFAARWGTACGRAFDARKFLTEHPQFEWMQGILESRPSEPWTVVTAGQRR